MVDRLSKNFELLRDGAVRHALCAAKRVQPWT
ncbi:unnamed protein product (plasmid) [Mycetohabitans rhizoxinica HKI 454]|uniref:Uncharacterized protein n=1 Tax=Mycetohabitans rhizoxinica (strain DSM 19002 / CIP 109453 / HKI 454) TaxID=882378 RepID=E5AUZ3_MYCRK|nr:unnamed protein product [Mycetohabitans rhizoxinica HKI 454]